MKTKFFKPAVAIFMVLLGLSACEKDPVVEPPVSRPPQQQLPNPLPTNALVKQVKWAETDHDTYQYNDKGQVSLIRSQWQYQENDPTKIRTILYDFQFDEQGKPVRVNTTGGFAVRYVYHDTLIERTQEQYPGGDVSRDVTYIYNNSRIVQETWRVSNLPGEPVSVYKHVFSYDTRGNLNKIEVSEQQENGSYKLLETIEYSDFDDKINPTSWTMRYPYLPQVRWQFNNPRREVRRVVGGAVETTTHAYEYNAQGLPKVKRTTRPSGIVLTAQYQY